MGGIYHPGYTGREAYTTLGTLVGRHIPYYTHLREAGREAYACIYTLGRLVGRHIPVYTPEDGRSEAPLDPFHCWPVMPVPVLLSLSER